MRIITALAASSAALVVLTTSSAQAAPASPSASNAGTCSLNAPARVAIGAPYMRVSLRLAYDCDAAGTVYASWDRYHVRTGWDGITIFDEAATDYWDVYDSDQLGQYEWRPSSAWDYDYNDVWQNSPTSNVRVASWSALTGTRSGSTARLNISVARYSGSYERYIPWTNKVGAIQIQKSGSTAWTHFGYVKSNAYGKATFNGAISGTTKVRVIFPNETYIWGVWTTGRNI